MIAAQSKKYLEALVPAFLLAIGSVLILIGVLVAVAHAQTPEAATPGGIDLFKDLYGAVLHGNWGVAMGAGEAHILNLCVRRDLRGRSVGRQMLMLVLERARQAGMETVFLEVRPSNPHAIALYQSVGFVQVGLRKGYYQAEGGREDALVLKLDLVDGRDTAPA